MANMTFGELFQLYYRRHVQVKNRCPENAHYFYKAHGPRWGAVLIEEITMHQVQEWVDELGEESQSSATRAVNMLSAVINWGRRRGYCTGDNPCRGVERFTIRSRERFLLPAELQAFKAALEQEAPLLRDFYWMCLLTGARRGNILSMKWSEIDSDLRIWQFVTKNGETQVLPLNSASLAILDRRQSGEGSPWVFPSPKKLNCHFVEPKRSWGRVLKRAKLNNLRIHDLRRTVGSYLAIHGASLILIGEVLGHKDQRSTAIYARLHLEPVRKALETTQQLFTAQSGA